MELAARIDEVTFADLDDDQVTELLREAIVQWGVDRGWRVYRRAKSVLRLPPPYQDRHSFVDVACARPDGPPIVVEIDRSDRKRSIEKLLAESEAGREVLWVRWGRGPFATPPPPIQLVPCVVTTRNRLHSRLPAGPPPPTHTTADLSAADQGDLF